MDRLPERPPNNASRLIAGAVSLVGDTEEVRTVMQSTPADFLDYCAGRKEPSLPELDRLISLIICEQGKIIAHNRELLRKMAGFRVERTSR
jgi:hypothetical protein